MPGRVVEDGRGVVGDRRVRSGEAHGAAALLVDREAGSEGGGDGEDGEPDGRDKRAGGCRHGGKASLDRLGVEPRQYSPDETRLPPGRRQSSSPSTNHSPRSRSRKRRNTPPPARPGGGARATSHSSREKATSHQSPEARHGPAQAATAPRTPGADTKAGAPLVTSTWARRGGRKARSATRGDGGGSSRLPRGRGGRGEGRDGEGPGAVGVDELRRAAAARRRPRVEPRHRLREPLRRGLGRVEQRELRRARGRRLGAGGDPEDRVPRGVRLEVEEDEGAPGARLPRRRHRPQRALVRRPVREAELDGERGRLRPARGERGAERLEHAAEEEGERLEAVHRPVELERRLEPLGERRGDEDAVVLAAGEPREARSLGPEARGEGHGGEPREVADRAQAPAPEEKETLLPDARGARAGAGRGRRPLLRRARR